MRAPLAPPRLSVPRKLAADAQAVEASCETVSPDAEERGLERSDVLVADQLVVDRRDRVLPQLRLGDPGAEVARDRTHVAVQQLVPGLGERQGELVGVLQEAPRDPLVRRVGAQREIAREHRRPVRLGRVVSVRHRRLGVLGDPLVRPGRARRLLPLVTEEALEEAVVPLGRGAGPGDLEAAGDGVRTLAGAVGVLPAEPLALERAALGLGTDVVGGRGTVGLAEGVAAGDEGDRLLVVHRHPAERLADVTSRRQRVGLAVGALRVDVDQTHLDGAERTGELAVVGVPLVAEPGVLRAPEDLLGLPHVHATEREPEGLEAHGLQRDVPGEDHQVRPRDLPSVLLLDRPEQAAGLVEVGVVGPAVERGETLGAVPGATPAVRDPVGAGGVPAHPDEQPSVVPEVGGPPVLRGGHHLDEVSLELLDVELLELLGVVEPGAQRVGRDRVLLEDLQVQHVRPPVLDRSRPARLRLGGVDRRVLALAALGSGFGHVRHVQPFGSTLAARRTPPGWRRRGRQRGVS